MNTPHPSQIQQDNRLKFKALIYGRGIRTVIVGLFLAAVCATLGVRILITTSIKGVVNAPILLIQSPIDGTVISDDIKAGNTIPKGAGLFCIANDRLDKSNEAHIRAQLGLANASIAGIQKQISGYTATKQSLEERLQWHLSANSAFLLHKSEETRSLLSKTVATKLQTARDLDRQKQLAGKGIDSAQAYENVQLKYEQLENEVRSLEAGLGKNTSELEANKQGVLLDGYSGAPYAQQRLDEVSLRMSEAEARLEDLKAEQEVLEVQLAESVKLNAKLLSTTIESPSLCLVQSIRVTKGTDVVKGTVLCELIDCAKSYVEATIPEKKFDQVRVGDPAEIYLYGSSKHIDGVVSSIRGAGAYNASNAEQNAARVIKTTPDSMLVSISFSVADAMTTFGSANQVGRTARVKLQ